MKNITFGAFAILITVFFVSSALNNGGSPGHKTGSPLDGISCTQCHGGTASSQTGWISSDIPASGYIAGQTYTIIATGTHSGAVKMGFELTSETSSAKTGTFTITNTTETKMISANDAVTNTSSGNTASSGTKSWTIDWTAPAQGTGDVDFYAAFNAANGNGSTTGDIIYTSSLLAQENISSNINDNENKILSIYPNPTTDFINISTEANTAKIYDIKGNIVNNYSNTSKIDLSGFNNGIYFIKIDNNKSLKFIKR